MLKITFCHFGNDNKVDIKVKCYRNRKAYN